MAKQTENRGQKTGNSKTKRKNSPPRIWPVWIFMLMAILLTQPSPALAQTETSVITIVTVTVLDEDGQPLAFLPIELILFKYAESIEAVAVGGCGTDDAGSCSIAVTDPPQASGWMEGLVTIPGLGRKYIGWTGAEKQVIIQLLPGNLMATPEGFLHPPYEGQPESGTDVPWGWEHVATLTVTPAIEPTATPTPLPPSPTLTITPAAIATATPSGTASETPAASPFPREQSASNDVLWPVTAGIVAAVLILILGFLVFLYRRRNKQDQPA